MSLHCNAVVFCDRAELGPAGARLSGVHGVFACPEFPATFQGTLFTQLSGLRSETALRVRFYGHGDWSHVLGEYRNTIQLEGPVAQGALEFAFPVDRSGWYTAGVCVLEGGVWKALGHAHIQCVGPEHELRDQYQTRFTGQPGPGPTGGP